MNDQKIFDRVLAHIRKQGEASERGNSCKYLIEENNKVLRCAAGIFITTHLDAMEGKSFPRICEAYPNNVEALTGDQIELIADMQHAHDNAAARVSNKSFLREFEEGAEDIAGLHDLKYIAL